jgi:hypothetical protein
MSKRRGNDEGSFGKRKDGAHYGTIQIDGKRHWAYGDTRKEAVEKIKELRKKVDQAVRWRYITFNAAALVEIPPLLEKAKLRKLRFHDYGIVALPS